MTDDTLRAMLAFFPILLVIAAIESAAIKSVRATPKWIGLVGVTASGSGLAVTLIEMFQREFLLDDSASRVFALVIWLLAGIAVAAAYVVAVLRFLEWVGDR